MPADLVRDGAELLFIVALAGMLWQVVVRLRRGEIRVLRCPHCGWATSRAYPWCRHCRSELSPPR